MHLLAWGGGTLLCCSAISFAALIAEPTAALAWFGFTWALVSHAGSGFLVIQGRGADGQATGAGALFSVGLAAFWTIVQGAVALALVSALHIQLSASNATLLLAISCGGLTLLFVVASRGCQTDIAAQFARRTTSLQRADTAKLLRN